MDIKKFYNANHHDINLRHPFNIDGRTIATDGIVLLSVPLNGDKYKDFAGATHGLIRSVLRQADALSFYPFSQIDFPVLSECFSCKGMGKSFRRECEECDGEGEVDVETDYSTYYGLECKSCHGEGDNNIPGGKIYCEACNGFGTIYDNFKAVDICGVKVNPNYLRLAVELNLSQVARFTVSPEAVAFKSEDVMLIIMGMR